MAKHKLTEHLGMTYREFKKMKRREHRILLHTIDQFRMGIALGDQEAYKEFLEATEHFDKMTKILKKWWAKA